jgi:hypothetical protein
MFPSELREPILHGRSDPEQRKKFIVTPRIVWQFWWHGCGSLSFDLQIGRGQGQGAAVFLLLWIIFAAVKYYRWMQKLIVRMRRWWRKLHKYFLRWRRRRRVDDIVVIGMVMLVMMMMIEGLKIREGRERNIRKRDRE